jgi:hypothetical protein
MKMPLLIVVFESATHWQRRESQFIPSSSNDREAYTQANTEVGPYVRRHCFKESADLENHVSSLRRCELEGGFTLKASPSPLNSMSAPPVLAIHWRVVSAGSRTQSDHTERSGGPAGRVVK